MNGQTDGAGLVHDGPLDGLTDPPGGIGGETEAALGVKLLDRTDKAEVALFDEIQQHQAAVVVTTGDFDHQSQVGLDHALAGGFVTSQGTTGVVDFLFGSEQRGETYLPQIELRGIHHLVQLRCQQLIGDSLVRLGGYLLQLFYLVRFGFSVKL